MADKTILRSTKVDLHGDKTDVKMIEDFVTAINSDKKMRYLANHRNDVPPIGYFDNAEIVIENDVYLAKAEPILYKNRQGVDWDRNYILESCGGELNLISKNENSSTLNKIGIDKNNFKDFKTFNKIGKELHDLFEGEWEIEPSMRKHLLPDPQLVIKIATYSTILYPLLKPVLKKIGEKLADDISDHLYDYAKLNSKKLLNKLAELIRRTRLNIIPTDKTLHTIFEISGELYTELHIKSNDHNRVIKSLNPSKLAKVHTQIEALKQNIEIAEIYFIFNEKNKWQFSYLISKRGEILGTKLAFDKRDKLVNRINLSPTKAMSVGATGVKYRNDIQE